MTVYPAQLWVARGGQWYRRGIAEAGAFVSGVTMPTTSNVGLTNPALLADLLPNSGQRYDVTTPGTVISNKRIKAHLRNLSGGDLTLNNCLITAEGTINATHNDPGSPPINYVDLGIALNSSGRMILNNCEIEPAAHQFWINCFRGDGTTAANPHLLNRCKLSGGTDSLNGSGNGGFFVNATDCLIGPQAFCSSCNDQSGSSPAYWTHNDGCQLQHPNSLFKAFGCTFISGAWHPKGDLATFASTSYADYSWGSALTYSGGAVSAPVFDIDQCWFVGPSQTHFQSNGTNLGTVASIRNSRVGFRTHDYGGSMYHFRTGSGTTVTGLDTCYWSAQCGSLSQVLGGTTYTKADGEFLTYATGGMSEIQKSLTGIRLGGL